MGFASPSGQVHAQQRIDVDQEQPSAAASRLSDMVAKLLCFRRNIGMSREVI
jgi:hypothetical protein